MSGRALCAQGGEDIIWHCYTSQTGTVDIFLLAIRYQCRLQHIVTNSTGSAAELSQQKAQRIPLICSTTLPMPARSLDLSSTTFQGGLPERNLSRMNRSLLRLLPLWKAAPST